jgi:ribosomal protein S5
LFIDSDSVTNVTALNRTNARRVLVFIGNGNGVFSFAMGKGDDYEQAFEAAFKKLRTNLIIIPMHWIMTSPMVMVGRHNDYRIKILPQE